VRLRLEDQGDGWFWDTPCIETEVLREQQVHSRRFYRLALAEPLELPGDALTTAQSGARAVTYCGAWLSPRWVGHEIGRDEGITALLWLVGEGQQADDPPRDAPHSARVTCREAARV
jgi:hypothetical protein